MGIDPYLYVESVQSHTMLNTGNITHEEACTCTLNRKLECTCIVYYLNCRKGPFL